MRKTSALAFAIMLLACDKGGDNVIDSAGGAAGTATAMTSLATQARNADLAKPIDQYTGAEFYSHVRGLQYVGGNERERRCRGCTGPRANQRTRVRVDGVEGVDSTAAGNIPQFGVVVARGLNRGGQQEDRYGMRPGARFEYYLIVLPGSPSGAVPVWRIEELEIVGNRYSRRQLATGRVVACNHPFERGARSDFRTCDNATPASPAALGILLQAGSGGDPWWYGCGTGCCIAENGGEG